jgi:hypothetical protein
MAQREFNKDISNYIEGRRISEDKIKDVEGIKKQAESKSVDELHPNLESGKIKVIEKEKSWMQRVFTSKPEEESEFEAEESRIEKPGYWKKFVEWLKRDEEVPVPERFEESVEKIEEKEEGLKQEDYAEEEVKELEHEKSNIIMSFVSRFRPQRKVTGLQEQIFELEDDLKAIAKITTSVMKQLAPEQLESYKKSSDFERFKVILRKRNLIREKPKSEPSSEQQ